MVKRPSKNVVAAAIICITLIELTALFNGMNGQLMTMAVAIIAGLAGYVIPSPELNS